jgi:hypothetical protein
MPPKDGNSLLRVSLHTELIKQLKKRAIDQGVQPCVLVEQGILYVLSSQEDKGKSLSKVVKK